MLTDTQAECIPLDQLTPEERDELKLDIQQLFVHPDLWLNTPHPLLDGHKPVEFLEPGREEPLRDLIAAIKYGIFA